MSPALIILASQLQSELETFLHLGAVSERYNEKLEKVQTHIMPLELHNGAHLMAMQYIAENPDNTLETKSKKEKSKVFTSSVRYSEKLFRYQKNELPQQLRLPELTYLIGQQGPDATVLSPQSS